MIGAIQLAIIVPASGSSMFEILIGDVELGQRPELLEVAIQPVENFIPVISVTDEQQTVIATDSASLIVGWNVWVQQTFPDPLNYSFILTKTLIDESGIVTGPTITLSSFNRNGTLFIDPQNGIYELHIPEYNPISTATDSDNGVYTLEGCKNRGTPSETCSSADISLFGVIILFDIDCRVDTGLFEIEVRCVSNLPVEVEFECFYDNRDSEDCDDFVLISLLEFSAETHTLRIVGNDPRGFLDEFALEFDGLNVDTLPPTRLDYYVSDPIDPTARPRTVIISEGGSADARSIVSIDGPIIRNITIRLVPLTYDEYEARFPTISLDDVFPSRPLPAEEGDFDRSPMTLSFVDERQDRRVRIPLPVEDDEAELAEGFLFLLEVDGQRTDPLDFSRLQILNNIILVVIEDNDQSIECSSNIDGDMVTFSCTDIDTLPPEVADNLECSVDFSSPEPCQFPYRVALSQIAPGEHYLRVLSREVGEPIPNEILGGTQFELPRLEVFFVNNTPILTGGRIYAEFETNRPDVAIECHLTRLDYTREDCSDGVFEREGIPPGDYTLRVVARDPSRPRERRAVARNRIWVHGDDEFCVVVLQNRGRTINRNSVTFEFQGTGLTNDYRCILDRTEFVQCSSPYTIENVPLGQHHFKIIPQGCARNFRAHPQKFTIN